MEKWPSAIDDCLDHVPLIARVPGYKQGHVSREIVELCDVMATCLELSGIEAQHTHFARSLIPQFRGEPGDPKHAAFCKGGFNTDKRQLFEPPMTQDQVKEIYYPKRKRCKTSIRKPLRAPRAYGLSTTASYTGRTE